VGLGLEHFTGPAEQSVCARVGLLQNVECLLYGRLQGLCVGQAAVLSVERLPFIGSGREFGQLANLPVQPLLLAGQRVLSLARLIQGALGRPPIAPGRLNGFGADPRVGIEQAAHCIWSCEALPCVLAMNV